MKSPTIAALAALLSLAAIAAAKPQDAREGPPTTDTEDDVKAPKLPTLGGKQFWTDVYIHGQWRIQRYLRSDHYRLLDDHNYPYASGSLDRCREQFERLKRERELSPPGPEVVITLHGLGRSRQSMSGIGQYLADNGGYGWINVEYASTRDRIESHAHALAQIIDGLEGVETIHFVGHSMGNIVIRQYLADREREEKPPRAVPRIGRIVMLAPPNHGSALAGRLRQNKLFTLFTGASGKQLADGWEELEKHLAVPNCEFGIIAGGRNGHRGSNPLVNGDDDLIVSVEETRLIGARDFLVVPAVHTFIMDDEQVQKATLNFLRHGYFISERQRQPIVDSTPRADH